MIAMYQESFTVGSQFLQLTNFTRSLIAEYESKPELRDYMPLPRFKTSEQFVDNWIKLCDGDYRKLLLDNASVVRCEDNVLFSSVYGNLRLYEFQLNALFVSWIKESSHKEATEALHSLGLCTKDVYNDLLYFVNDYNLQDRENNPNTTCLFYLLECVNTGVITRSECYSKKETL